MELKDIINIYISGVAAIAAFGSLGYQFWRDLLSTSPKVSVLAAYNGTKLDVALANRRNPTVIVEIGLCTLTRKGRMKMSEVLSKAFHPLDDQGVLVFSDILNAGVPRELEDTLSYKVFVTTETGKKFYSAKLAIKI
jgi:hypothetical protein